MIGRARPAFASLAAAVAVVAGCQFPPTRQVARPNVLVVIVDSLRSDRLALWNREAAAATPHLDRLAASGVVFTNAWAVTPWTAPSVVSVFTGLYPPSHGVVHRDDTTAPGLPTLATLLAAEGYRLGNFSFFSHLSYFANLGFPAPDSRLGHRHATAMFRDWAPGGSPFVAWVHLIEPHLPYGASGYSARAVGVPGSSGLERCQLAADVPVGSVSFADGDREVLSRLYDRDLEAMDAALGELLATLADAGLTDSTLVVVVADHGEELLDRGWVGHASTSLEAKLIPEILRIPLLLAGPSVPRGVVSDALVQQVDVLPTLLSLADVTSPDTLDGRPIRFSRNRADAGRRRVFFDSTTGGNLTPLERRDERWQGVSDGACLLTVHTHPGGSDHLSEALTGAACTPRTVARLERDLAEWQEDQVRQRLTLLGDRTTVDRPPASDVATFAEDLPTGEPAAGATLTWAATGGTIRLVWPATGSTCWVEYDVGEGLTRAEGAFPTTGDGAAFGPFPQGFWNDLAGHNPYRYRLLCPELGRRSPWVEFRLAPSP